MLVVDVDLDEARVARHEDRVADAVQMSLDRVDVQHGSGRRGEQEDRLVAERLFLEGGDAGRERGRDRRPPLGVPGRHRPGEAGRDMDRPALDAQQRALEQAKEALPARVDDTRLAQDRQQRRRPGDGLPCSVDGRREHGFHRVVAFRGLDRGGRGLADHGQDRSLDGLAHRAIRGLGPERQCVREIEPAEPPLAGEALGKPAQDLAGDDAGVAARSHQRAVADRGGHALHRHLAAGPLGLLQRGPRRRDHVRAGVSVRDREDVQRVDLVGVGLEVRHRAPHRIEKSGPRAVRPRGGSAARAGVRRIARGLATTSGHQATSVPLAARSSGRIGSTRFVELADPGETDA